LQAHVSAAKAGVDALSQVIAVEEGPWGVRSNVISPGPIAGTEGMDRLDPKRADGSRDELRYFPSVPLGRQGGKVECASAAVYLFSGAASWVTGAVLVVDGGAQHFSALDFPYPASVLDPESLKAKL
jgi:peroxisomal 2,4-dienoyl-CoA reductase